MSSCQALPGWRARIEPAESRWPALLDSVSWMTAFIIGLYVDMALETRQDLFRLSAAAELSAEGTWGKAGLTFEKARKPGRIGKAQFFGYGGCALRCIGQQVLGF